MAEAIQHKKCTKCKVLKSLDNFWRDQTMRNGYSCQCKKCKHMADRVRHGLPAIPPPPPACVDLPGEEWKPIPQLEGVYSVSNKGRVRRDKPEANTYAGRILKPRMKRGGYYHVQINNHLGVTKRMTRPVHQCVAAAFLGPRPEGFHTNHKDGCKTNNSADNLEYVTRKENATHAAAMGLYRTGKSHPYVVNPSLHVRGERAGLAKLNEPQVRVIKRLCQNMRYTEIARVFGVGPCAIRNIDKGLTWKHVVL